MNFKPGWLAYQVQKATNFVQGDIPSEQRIRFIILMIIAYARRYPGMKAEEAMERAAQTYRDFMAREKIEFADRRYDWTESGAETLVAEFEQYA